MKTLIELYDERPIENVVASEVFRPERTIFLCPTEVAQNKVLQAKLSEYFVSKGLNGSLEFWESSMYNSGKLLKQLQNAVKNNKDCAIDITGGTDAALFAAGMFCSETNIPVFTYSRKKNRFYNINNAEFANDKPCTICHTVADCFLMAGGAMRTGRVDNSVLAGYMEYIDGFYKIYLRYRNRWTKIIKYFQTTSQVEKGKSIPLKVNSEFSVSGDFGKRIDAPEDCLFDLEKLGFLRNVSISREGVHYEFMDLQVRSWLRDMGSVLELYIYKAFIDSGHFNEVRTSVVVEWEGESRRDSVSNEIDVMAMKGIMPIFVSCKTCEIDTDALNELAILRDRFGGESAKAVIVTTKNCRNVTRHRAAELDISVIDRNDLTSENIASIISTLAK